MARPAIGGAAGALTRFYWVRQRLAAHTTAHDKIARDLARFYRNVWEDAAAGTGARFSALSGSILEIRIGSSRLRIRGNSTSLDDPVTLDMAGDKRLVYELLSAAAVPVPRFRVQDDWSLTSARAFVAGSATPCVVKPASGTAGGAGVSTGVRSGCGLLLAFAFARAFCPSVLIEEGIEGDNYRLLYFDGELLDAILRRPPAISGDGRSTVRQLVTAENCARARSGAAVSHSLVHVDHDLRHTLRGQGLSLVSVPGRGRLVRLKNVVSENRAEDNEPATDTLCPAVVGIGARAAAAVGVRLAGVDVVTSDPGRPLEETGGAIIEVNTTPSLYYHYMKKGGPTPVARAILERWAKRREP